MRGYNNGVGRGCYSPRYERVAQEGRCSCNITGRGAPPGIDVDPITQPQMIQSITAQVNIHGKERR